MKNINFILVCFVAAPMFFAISLNAQDKFTVIKVNGNIVITRTGSALDIGTAFAQNEDLQFKSEASRAAVINPQRGRYLLTSENLSEFRNSKSDFLPSSGKISSRGMGAILDVNDLKNLLEGNYVILDRVKIVLNLETFPMNDKKYFYIRYSYKNETINKKLSFSGDTLFISKKELFTVDGMQIPNPEISEMKLMYMEEGLNFISTPICTFTPVFPDFVQLRKEVLIIADQMKGRSYKDKFIEISSFINDFYGKHDLENLRDWLGIYCGIKQ
jgi:hypothetical protein